MNFESYRSHVYNVGSPTPTARRNLAERFPTNKPPSSAKRKFAPDEETEVQKSSKMVKVGDMEFEDLVKALQNAFKADIDKVSDEVKGVRDEMVKDRQDAKLLDSRVGKVETDLEAIRQQLEAKVPSVGASSVEEVKQAVLPEVEKIVISSVNTQWQDVLANEVKQFEDELIIHGLDWPTGCPKQGFRNFCKEGLKMEADRVKSLEVKEVTKLGNPKGGRPAPQKVKLGSASDRNDCLRLSKNLKKGVSLDKCVPKRYLDKYKSFKNLAWKIRVAKNMHTYIGFDRQALQLKVKKKDDGTLRFDWTIHAEYIPKPSKNPSPSKVREPRAGLIPTQPLSDSDTECVCIVSGLKTSQDNTQLAEKIALLFDESDLPLVSNISVANSSVGVLTCEDRDAALKLANKYNDRQFEGAKISVQTFSSQK